MSPYCGAPEELMGHQETSYGADQWRRWDEELVEEFGRWLSRLARAFSILFLAVSAVIVIRWF